MRPRKLRRTRYRAGYRSHRERCRRIERAIAAIASVPSSGMAVLPDSTTTINRDLIIALAARHRLPAVYNGRLFVAAGGLMSYGFIYRDQYRQVLPSLTFSGHGPISEIGRSPGESQLSLGAASRNANCQGGPSIMRIKAAAALVTFVGFVTSGPAFAQDISGRRSEVSATASTPTSEKSFKSNTGIILTQDGVVLIDSGHDPTDLHAVMDAVKKLDPDGRRRFRIIQRRIPITQPDISSSHPPRPSSPRPGPGQMTSRSASIQIRIQSSPRRPRP